MKRILVTGCAGFIGFHVSQRLLQNGNQIIGLDNLNHYYDEGLKSARLSILQQQPEFTFAHCDLGDTAAVDAVFQQQEFGPIAHLAAQAGVRYSIENPYVYIQSNVVGFANLIEAARRKKPPHFLFASSSSVYGSNKKVPFSEHDNVDHPVSLYAATKKSNELIAHVYAHLYDLPVTGLRFFTVYGPWGRPDMAMFKFCKSIFEGTPIDLYNHGDMLRDFTYIDDVVEGVIRILEKPPVRRRSKDGPAAAPYRIFNIGNHRPVEVKKLIQMLESKIGKKALVKPLPMQPGDVPVTYADVDKLKNAVGFSPHTTLEDGVDRFVAWYREYYKL